VRKEWVEAVATVVSDSIKVTTATAAPLLQKATPVVKVSSQRNSQDLLCKTCSSM